MEFEVSRKGYDEILKIIAFDPIDAIRSILTITGDQRRIISICFPSNKKHTEITLEDGVVFLISFLPRNI